MAVDTTAPSYWFNWRFLLCAIWILGAIFVSVYLIWKYEWGNKSKHQTSGNQKDSSPCLYHGEAWSTCSKSIHPIWLLAYRMISFCAMLAFILADTIVHSPGIFFFYTQWTFTIVTIYFALASTLSIYGCLQNCHSERDYSAGTDAEQGSIGGDVQNVASMSTSLNLKDAKKCSALVFWGNALQILFQVCGGAVVLTDSVFWLILYPFFSGKNTKLQFLAASMHSFNAVFLIGDTMLNNLKFPFFRIAYFVLWTSTFVVFQWIFHAFVSVKWPYPFLDLSSPYAPIWYLGVGLLHLPCYGIFALIFKTKQCCFSR
ncbi:uncharacterized protein LOC127263701 [Andrographis paniculata]|uniref:uncharacterized protein LOC127263701 n=1 Tax=Andrographis paniculata TaxID=175694 RepID=UPI0021E6E0FA|nr:uncharacterized protein LOC127263701 [Andrographis paniculata]XP_051148826.1 uncharacterized protein LOC127263701 [Andrographis paniculata]